MARPAGLRSLSVVLPARNEAARVGAVVRDALAELDRRGIPGEVIVVDDGSVDGTCAVVAALGPRVRVVRLTGRGYGAAVRAGVAVAVHEHVLLTDADGQFVLSDLARLEACLDGADVVVGVRTPRRDPWARRVAGVAWSRILDVLLGVGVQDVDCAFKLVPRALLQRVELRSDGAFVSAELLLGARALGAVVSEVPVHHRPRRSGRGTGLRPRVVWRAASELAAWWRATHGPSPASARARTW